LFFVIYSFLVFGLFVPQQHVCSAIAAQLLNLYLHVKVTDVFFSLMCFVVFVCFKIKF